MSVPPPPPPLPLARSGPGSHYKLLYPHLVIACSIFRLTFNQQSPRLHITNNFGNWQAISSSKLHLKLNARAVLLFSYIPTKGWREIFMCVFFYVLNCPSLQYCWLVVVVEVMSVTRVSVITFPDKNLMKTEDRILSVTIWGGGSSMSFHRNCFQLSTLEYYLVNLHNVHITVHLLWS